MLPEVKTEVQATVATSTKTIALQVKPCINRKKVDERKAEEAKDAGVLVAAETGDTTREITNTPAKPCFNYSQHRKCKYGDRCLYSHGDSHPGSYKTLPCKYFMLSGQCRRGVSCHYKHGETDSGFRGRPRTRIYSFSKESWPTSEAKRSVADWSPGSLLIEGKKGPGGEHLIERRSCGCVPFRMIKEGIQYLVILQKAYVPYWSFPKGSPEKGESSLDAAKRELLEETRLSGDDVMFYRGVIDVKEMYNIPGMIRDTASSHDGQSFVMKKTVEFFLCKVNENAEVCGDRREVLEKKWLPYEEAVNLLGPKGNKYDWSSPVRIAANLIEKLEDLEVVE